MTTQVCSATALHSRRGPALSRLSCALRVERCAIETSKVVAKHRKISSRLQKASSLLSDVQLAFYDICLVLYEARPDLWGVDPATTPIKVNCPYVKTLRDLELRGANSRTKLKKAKALVDAALIDYDAPVELLDLTLPDPVGRISAFSGILYDCIENHYVCLDQLLEIASTDVPGVETRARYLGGVWTSITKAAKAVKRMMPRMPKLYQCWSARSLGAENVDDALVKERILRSFQDDQMPVWLQNILIDYYDEHPEEKARIVDELARQDEEDLCDMTNATALDQIASEQTVTEVSYVKAELEGVCCRRVRQPAEKRLCRAVKPSFG